MEHLGEKIIISFTKIILFVLSSLAFSILFFYFTFFERIVPNTYVNSINIGGLTKDEAYQKLLKEIKPPEEFAVLIEDKKTKINLKEIDFNYNFRETVEKAYSERRSKNHIETLKSIYQKTTVSLIFSYDSQKLEKTIEDIIVKNERKGQKPEAVLENGKVRIINGKAGIIIEKENIKNKLEEKIKQFDLSPIAIDTISDNYVLDYKQLEEYKIRVEKLLGKKMVISLDADYEKELKDKEIINLTDYFEGYQKEKIESLTNQISKDIERPPQNPIFNIEEGIVKEFKPAKDGITLDKENFIIQLKKSFEKIENSDQKIISFEIPVKKTPPDYKTEDVNSLGIREILGFGKSKFVGSIQSRIHNIKLASSKFNGILVKPDEIFSFNQILGEVSKETGYQQAYIIKEGQTVLGDGGGVCQVSTTLFRAALNAGLPIIERQAHAYRVSYYEQDSPPGLDATVFSPSPDLKFKNDTPGHLLIQSKFDANNKSLTFEIYGTKDNRQVYISKPVVSSTTPPPEDLYIDDPTLPSGQIKQIDWKAWGAKVWFDYKVTKGNQEVFSKRFYSNYRPWQAKFLRGTGTTP